MPSPRKAPTNGLLKFRQEPFEGSQVGADCGAVGGPLGGLEARGEVGSRGRIVRVVEGGQDACEGAVSGAGAESYESDIIGKGVEEPLHEGIGVTNLCHPEPFEVLRGNLVVAGGAQSGLAGGISEPRRGGAKVDVHDKWERSPVMIRYSLAETSRPTRLKAWIAQALLARKMSCLRQEE